MRILVRLNCVMEDKLLIFPKGNLVDLVKRLFVTKYNTKAIHFWNYRFSMIPGPRVTNYVMEMGVSAFNRQIYKDGVNKTSDSCPQRLIHIPICFHLKNVLDTLSIGLWIHKHRPGFVFTQLGEHYIDILNPSRFPSIRACLDNHNISHFWQPDLTFT